MDVTNPRNGALAEARKKIGYVFQGAALLNWMSVYDNIALPLREHENMTPDQVNERVMEKLTLVGLPKDGQKMPSEISGGMKKRAGLARAIVRNPEIILYDEPTAGLDPVMGTQINALILDMQKKLSVTSVLVTHDAMKPTQGRERTGTFRSIYAYRHLESAVGYGAVFDLCDLRARRPRPGELISSCFGR